MRLKEAQQRSGFIDLRMPWVVNVRGLNVDMGNEELHQAFSGRPGGRWGESVYGIFELGFDECNGTYESR